MKKAILAVLIALPAFAADAPAPSAPLALLLESFGAPGLEVLASRGLIALQGKPAARRLTAIHWKALSALDRAKASCLALAAAADALGNEPAPSAAALEQLAVCRALPSDGVMTPSLHALAIALQAGYEERWALHQANASPAQTPGRPNLFDTPWGKDLIERRHADALENPASLVKPLFDELLAGPRPNKDAAALIAAEAAGRGAAGVEKLIAYDSAHGALSEELRAQLRRTLSNERRRWAVAKARAAAADLLGKAPVKRELEDLRLVAKSLSSRPNLPAALEAAITRAAPASGGPRLKSAGLHLQDPTRLDQYELGDAAIVSGAYWVDGLKENESVEVEETTALETERGFLAVESKSYSRKNGGPYPYARTLKLAETRPFAVRSLVSTAAGRVLSERVELPLSRDFELVLMKESKAAGLRASCRLKEAEAEYQALETLVASPAKVKPQYKEVAERAKKAREAAKAGAETQAKLEEALEPARADSAPQQCKYETKRVDAALALSKTLPPGCDRNLPELHALRATIVKRAADQNWFMKASSEARSKRKSCDLDAARTRWSEALASLDADPGARCGKVADEETKVKTEFAELTRKIAWREDLGKTLTRADSETAPARRLDILRPVTSRLGALNADCLSAESKRAATLSAAASKALTAPADNDLNRRLPADDSLSAVVADVRAERARRLEAAGASEKAAMESAPVQTPKAAAPVPTAKPAAKKQAAKRPKRKTQEAE